MKHIFLTSASAAKMATCASYVALVALCGPMWPSVVIFVRSGAMGDCAMHPLPGNTALIIQVVGVTPEIGECAAPHVVCQGLRPWLYGLPGLVALRQLPRGILGAVRLVFRPILLEWSP